MFTKNAKTEDVENAIDTYGDLSTCPLLRPEVVKPRRRDDGKDSLTFINKDNIGNRGSEEEGRW
jgi:hypothetical protein